MIEMLTSPLLPADFRTVPFEDARPCLRDWAALRALADRLGYVYLPGWLPAEPVKQVRAFVRDVCGEHGFLEPDAANPACFRARPLAGFGGRGFDDPRFVELQRRLVEQPAYRALGEHPALLEVLEWLVGRTVWLATANYCWLKFPGSPVQTTRPHEDAYYLPYCPELWTAWVPLVDTSLALGSLGVIPGSHRRGPWPHVSNLVGILVDPHETFATGAVEAGDLVLFGARTVHCAWSNVTETLVRAALDLRYEPRPAQGGTLLRPMP